MGCSVNRNPGVLGPLGRGSPNQGSTFRKAVSPAGVLEEPPPASSSSINGSESNNDNSEGNTHQTARSTRLCLVLSELLTRLTVTLTVALFLF